MLRRTSLVTNDLARMLVPKSVSVSIVLLALPCLGWLRVRDRGNNVGWMYKKRILFFHHSDCTFGLQWGIVRGRGPNLTQRKREFRNTHARWPKILLDIIEIRVASVWLLFLRSHRNFRLHINRWRVVRCSRDWGWIHSLFSNWSVHRYEKAQVSRVGIFRVSYFQTILAHAIYYAL